MATEARKNTRYDLNFNKRMDSSPMISATEVFWPFLPGGVSGNVKLNRPSSNEAPAAILKVSASEPVCSQFSQPMTKPATIHPAVPKIRINGKSLLGSVICLNETEFTNASVGI